MGPVPGRWNLPAASSRACASRLKTSPLRVSRCLRRPTPRSPRRRQSDDIGAGRARHRDRDDAEGTHGAARDAECRAATPALEHKVVDERFSVDALWRTPPARGSVAAAGVADSMPGGSRLPCEPAARGSGCLRPRRTQTALGMMGVAHPLVRPLRGSRSLTVAIPVRADRLEVCGRGRLRRAALVIARDCVHSASSRPEVAG